MMRTIRLRTLGIAALAVLAGGLGTASLLVWLGIYDVSATSQHTAPVYKLLDYAMRRSVADSARDLVAPSDLDAPARADRGAVHYRAACVQCHGAPGVAPDRLAYGMTPAPANLLSAGRAWPAGELFWVIKHGIKMSGMPAWAWRLSDAEMWDVVSFVRTMPRLAPADYQALVRRLPQPDEGDRLQAAAHRSGEVEAGRQATARYLCATCHGIPGVVGAEHHVGPPLAGMGTRSFIAGVLPNTPDNMVRFLLDPQRVDPLSAMPPLGLTEQDARDITAYLATLDKVPNK